MSPEVMALQERLQEEQLALEARESDLYSMRQRIASLARCVLDGVAAASQLEARLDAAADGVCVDDEEGGGDKKEDNCTTDGVSPSSPRLDEKPVDLESTFPSGVVNVAVALKRSGAAGELIPSEKLIAHGKNVAAVRAKNSEAVLLRAQVAALAEELAQRESLLSSVRGLAATNVRRADTGVDEDVTMQIMLAEREFLQAQLHSSDEHSDRLARALERMRRQLATAKGVELDTVGYGLDEDEEDEEVTATVASAARTLRRGYDHVLAEKVLAMESKVSVAIDALRQKEEQISSQRAVLSSLAGLEDQIQGQLAEVTAENGELRSENANLRREMDRLEALNNHVQGYYLDDLSHAELSELIGTLTQAVERVRITVQLRRLARGKRNRYEICL